MSAAAILTTMSLLCVSLDRIALGKALARLKHLVPARAAMPVDESVLVESANDHVTLTATDHSTYVRLAVPAEVTTRGVLLVSLRRLAGLTGSGPRHIELSGTTATLGAATHRLSALDASLYPAVPTPCGAVLSTLLRATLARALAATTYAMSHDETRPHMSALLLERRAGELRFVATDGHRLALARVGDDGPDFTLLVARRTIEELTRLVVLHGGVVRIQRDGDRVWFVSGDEWISGKVVQETFPFYDQVIPDAHEGEIAMPTGNLREMLRALAPRGTLGVKLTLELDAARVRLAVVDDDSNIAEAEVLASFTGTLPEAIGFNAQHLREVLDVLTHDDVTVTFLVGSSRDPVRINGTGEVTAVVMPMSV